MHFDYQGIGHPTQNQLVDFTESLMDQHATVSALLASHIADCSKCASEVKRMRASLEAADLSRLPEPSGVLTQTIILRARSELNKRNHSHIQSVALRAAQITGCVLAATILAVFSFSTALNEASIHTYPPEKGKLTLVSESAAHVSVLLERARNIKALSTSLSIQQDSTDSPREIEYRRALEILDHDLNAAMSALQRNPGSTRASQVMLMSLDRQLEGLRGLYLDRTF